MFRSSNRAANDMDAYQRGYPGKLGLDDAAKDQNLRFYQNNMPSRPDGALIDTIHKKWWGRYGGLERHHGYIQWLFPIHESGMNWESQVLQRHEAVAISSDAALQARVLVSYRLMLDFYGMQLADEQTGEVRRRPAGQFEERYRNLNTSSHNYLRITRILKSLGEFGLERLKLPFLRFFLSEATLHGHLRNALRSCLDYWVPCLRQKADRDALASEHTAMKHQKRKRGPDGGGSATADASAPERGREQGQRSKVAHGSSAEVNVVDDDDDDDLSAAAASGKRSKPDDDDDSQATELDAVTVAVDRA